MSDDVKTKGELFAEACERWADCRENTKVSGEALDEINEENAAWCAVYDLFEGELREVERLRSDLVAVRALNEDLNAERNRLRAENAALKTEARTRDAEHASLLEAQIKRLEREYQEAQNGFNDHVALCRQLQAENAELRMSVATMSCNHKGIGLPDCRICDPNTKPGAGT